jgi:hypothetical protein
MQCNKGYMGISQLVALIYGRNNMIQNTEREASLRREARQWA